MTGLARIALMSLLLLGGIWDHQARAEDSESPSPQHSRILPVKIKPVQEGADGVSKAAPDIEQRDEIDPDTVALYQTQSEGSLGQDLWKGMTREQIVTALRDLPVPQESPLQRDLTLRVLLTQADVPLAKPDKDGKTSPDVFTARLSRLVEIGAFKEAMQLYEKLETPPSNADSALAGMKAFVGNNQVAIACLEQRALDKALKSDDPFWDHLDKFCTRYIRIDDTAGSGDVSQSLMRAAITYAKDEKIFAPARFEDLNDKTLIELLVLAKSGLLDSGKWTASTASRLSPRVVSFLLAIGPTSADQKLSLMTVGLGQGLLSPLDLDAAFEQSSTAREWANFLSLRKKLKDAHEIAAKASAAAALLGETDQASLSAMTPFTDMILNLKPEDPPFSVQAARRFLGIMAEAGTSLPVAWVRFAYPSDSPEVLTESGESGESLLLSAWLQPPETAKESQDKSPTPPKGSKQPQSAEQLYLLILKDFLDENLVSKNGQNFSYEKFLSLTGASNYVMPSNALMDRLKGAAKAGNSGQVILAGLQALEGRKVDQIHPAAIIQVLKAFRSVGLSEETTSLAREVLAGLIKKKEN